MEMHGNGRGRRKYLAFMVFDVQCGLETWEVEGLHVDVSATCLLVASLLLSSASLSLLPY